ncbi:hypothetical protein K6L44_10930 [Gluconacetobacter entanii]|nr:hypothetical protein [Gluconacetobacter entanii]MBY4640488.1 hypothetical protein [Gluconacetobacter entanii]MCW4579604.1 hypothetical protein [Gluconacetobacter entanii]MCW4583029.1 hypothetical protein [Gluconacetobacter entanii]MCW4586420.1 hypothetical protein [Gluconacetobacter entanii]
MKLFAKSFKGTPPFWKKAAPKNFYPFVSALPETTFQVQLSAESVL